MKKNGFTLIEVLIALAIIAIALTALFKNMGQNVLTTTRLKERTISHIIAMQAINNIQLGLINDTPTQNTTHVTKMFGQNWYWRAAYKTTPILTMQQIKITTSVKSTGPFLDPLIGFRYIQ